MDVKLFILMIVIASIATFSLSLADSVELLASKTEAYKGENVLLVAVAKFSSTTAVRVDKIEIFENDVKIKECRNSGSEQYFCFAFVKSDVCPVTREYFARVTYTVNYDPTIESNRVRISWVCPPENVQVPAINVTSILDLLNQVTNNNVNILSVNNTNLFNAVLEVLVNTTISIVNNNNNTNINNNDITNVLSQFQNLINNITLLLNNNNVINNTNINNNNITNVLNQLQSLINNITLLLNNTNVNTYNPNLNNLLNVIQTMDLSDVSKIYDKLASLLFVYSSIYTKSYYYSYSPAIYSLAATSSEDLCLDFEKIENRIIEDRRVNVFVRNCGNFALYNVTVMFVLGENVQIKVIPFILPNEVKFVYFDVNVKEGERKLASVFAFNDLVSIKADFYVEKISPILTLKVEIPQVNLVKGKWNEFFITVKNLDVKTLQDLQVIVEGERNTIVNVEVPKISLLPLQSRNIKVSVFVSEEFDKNKALFRFNVGGIERIVEMNVIEEKRKTNNTGGLTLIGGIVPMSFGEIQISLVILVILATMVLIVLILVLLLRKRVTRMQRTIEV